MASPEVPLQIDLFSGELVDARTKYQKKKDWERSVPPQLHMFKTPDVVQFGVLPKSAYRVWAERATLTPLSLELEVTRSPEEIERDLIREAEKQTFPMFAESNEPQTCEPEPITFQPQPQSAVIIFDSRSIPVQLGLRASLRARSIPVRSRFTRQSFLTDVAT